VYNYFLFLALVSQNEQTLPEPPPLESPPAELTAPNAAPTEPAPAQGGLQENFDDPFANPSGPEGSPQPNAAPDFPSKPTGADELPKFEEPKFEEPKIEQPPPEVAPVVPPQEAQPQKSFEFPEFGKTEGPITQSVIENEEKQESTKMGAWILSASGGGALNMNQALNQAEIDFDLGYRLGFPWELHFTPYYRFVRTKLLGFLFSIRYQMRLTKPSSFRIEWAPSLGLGLTLRAVNSSFNQSQLPLRLQSDFAFYASPRMAITAGLGLEMFYMRFSGGKARSLMSAMPTQALGLAGLRFEF